MRYIQRTSYFLSFREKLEGDNFCGAIRRLIIGVSCRDVACYVPTRFAAYYVVDREHTKIFNTKFPYVFKRKSYFVWKILFTQILFLDKLYSQKGVFFNWIKVKQNSILISFYWYLFCIHRVLSNQLPLYFLIYTILCSNRYRVIL